MRHKNALPSHKLLQSYSLSDYIWHADWWCETLPQPIRPVWQGRITDKEADKADKICHGCQHRFFSEFFLCKNEGLRYEPIKPVLALAQKGINHGTKI